ncbi:fluoride efflux transporter CrcB [Agromyces fucosus]|uniref:Fluoride-specific ion channel FluC n=1 Tax=Agromyces fucosus TaxID=41985 RepID=A0A4V1QT39_9MICO|nr:MULTISPECIES: fluoride efflux transporter CrcB [Agromyces]KQZ08297.1 chromosome condensation protein CrcB [Agromyces sp. Root1464]RXZ50553.1 fluoride efflux transporter CrcB [Agromyces fucosus]
MTLPLFLLVVVAGGLGAGVRFVVDGVIRSRVRTAFPWATTIINVSGSFALGLVVGATLANLLAPEFAIVLGTGFLGGYTTFSTASYETVQLIRQRRVAASLVSGVLMLVSSVAAAGLGLWLGSAF